MLNATLVALAYTCIMVILASAAIYASYIILKPAMLPLQVIVMYGSLMLFSAFVLFAAGLELLFRSVYGIGELVIKKEK